MQLLGTFLCFSDRSAVVIVRLVDGAVGVGARVGHEPLGLRLGLRQVLVSGLLGERQHLHRLLVVVRQRGGRVAGVAQGGALAGVVRRLLCRQRPLELLDLGLQPQVLFLHRRELRSVRAFVLSSPAAGVAVLDVDDGAVSAMERRTVARVVRFGRSAAAQIRAVDVVLDDRGCPAFRLLSPAGEASVRLAVAGEHQVSNALAAAAVALELGATPAGVAATLSRYRPASRWRMEVTERPDGVTVINDAYNANPESVAAALRTLVVLAGAHRRSWAVLGPLAELGETATQAYRDIAALIARLGVDRLVVVGEQARQLHCTVPGSVLVPYIPAALELLHGELAAGDVVLIKASRSFGLERIAADLLSGSSG